MGCLNGALWAQSKYLIAGVIMKSRRKVFVNAHHCQHLRNDLEMTLFKEFKFSSNTRRKKVRPMKYMDNNCN